MINEFVHLIGGSRWLMEPRAMRAMLTRVAATSSHEVEAARIAYAGMADRAVQPTLMGDVAVIGMSGPIVYRMSWFSMLFGCASVEAMQQQFRSALADPSVRTILFRCDSPGGIVDMVPEFADEIFAARGTKPLLAVADTQVCSAAYWLASQCEAIYASRSSMLGSIGVYTDHEDISGMLEKIGVKITLIAHPAEKVEGNPYEPLSEMARANLQGFVDEVGLEFEAAVVRGRGVPKATVADWTTLGIPPRGKRAIALGLADKAGTFDGVIAKLTKGRTASGARASVLNPAVHEEVRDTRAAAAVKTSGCVTCGRGSVCACTTRYEGGACPADCPTCDPECLCVTSDEDAKATATADALARQMQADRDLTETTLALVRHDA